jgi:hypothetical protein
MSNDILCIRKGPLSENPGGKLGSVTYRLTYEDDAEWARFMDNLNRCTREQTEVVTMAISSPLLIVAYMIIQSCKTLTYMKTRAQVLFLTQLDLIKRILKYSYTEAFPAMA